MRSCDPPNTALLLTPQCCSHHNYGTHHQAQPREIEKSSASAMATLTATSFPASDDSELVWLAHVIFDGSPPGCTQSVPQLTVLLMSGRTAKTPVNKRQRRRALATSERVARGSAGSGLRGRGHTVAFQLIAAPERVRLHRLAANLQLHHHEPNHPVQDIYMHDAVFFATQSRFQQRRCDLRRDQVDP